MSQAKHLTTGAPLVVAILALAAVSLTANATAAASRGCLPYPSARQPYDPTVKESPCRHKQARLVKATTAASAGCPPMVYPPASKPCDPTAPSHRGRHRLHKQADVARATAHPHKRFVTECPKPTRTDFIAGVTDFGITRRSPGCTDPRPHKQTHAVSRITRTRDAAPTRGPRPRCFNPYTHRHIRCH